MRGDLAVTPATVVRASTMAFFCTAGNDIHGIYIYSVTINCNYYIAHRDTTLMTGSTNVTMNEYAAVKAFRAWAYLMLVRNYGEVPFFTEPLTKISEINSNSYPVLNLTGIVSRLAPDLEQYAGFMYPIMVVLPAEILTSDNQRQQVQNCASFLLMSFLVRCIWRTDSMSVLRNTI